QALAAEHEDADRNRWRAQTRKLIFEETFGNDFGSAHCIDVLRAHEADVIASVPPERLLVFELADGWEPLCAFLDVSVPDETFPHANTTAEFRVWTGLDAANG